MGLLGFSLGTPACSASRVRLIGDMNVSLNGCQSLCVRLQQTGHLSRAYPGFRPMAAAIRSILDGWML